MARGDERHRAAWRLHPLWRHVPGLLRLCARRHPPVGADGPARDLRADPRLHRPRRGRPDASAGRASRRRCAPCRICSCSAPPTRSRPRNAGSWRSPQTRRPPRSRCRARTCRRLRTEPSTKTSRPRAPMCCAKPTGARDVTLLATGSEVEIARRGRGRCSRRRASRPRSSPCPAGSCSRRRPTDYRAQVLGTAPRVGVEAALRFGWDRWLGENGAFIGMNGFGASRARAASSTSTSASPRRPWPPPPNP